MKSFLALLLPALATAQQDLLTLLTSSVSDTNNYCKAVSTTDNFYGKWLDTSVNTTRTCFNQLGSLTDYDSIKKCADKTKTLVELFRPSMAGGFVEFEGDDIGKIQKCADDDALAAGTGEGSAYELITIFAKRFFGCDFSEMDADQKQRIADLFDSDNRANVATLRSFCIVLHDGDDLYIDTLKMSHKLLLSTFRAFTQSR